MSHPRYARAPLPPLSRLLAPDGMLAPLLRPRVIAGMRLDVHFRKDNHVHAYCGLTRIIDASLVGERLRINASPTYRKKDCAAGLFRDWAINDPAFGVALERYLTAVDPGSGWTSREGTVQASWGTIAMPWMPLDREAVLGYPSESAQAAARNVSSVRAARDKIAVLQQAESWAQLPKCENGRELDQLAIDAEGRLVVIELKYARASAPSVYYAPLQLLQYVHEWHRALSTVRRGLDAVRRARIESGLSPTSTPELREGLRAVLAFGEEHCWPKVADRLERVFEIVDQHLPTGVLPIELWAMRSGEPKRLR